MSHLTDSTGIAQRIRRVLIEALRLDLSQEELGYSDHLHDLVAMDSVAVIGFIVALEKEFGVTFEPEWLDLERLTDLPTLADYIHRRTTGSLADSIGPASV